MAATVILKSGKDQSVRRYHPWIFSGAIKKIKGEVSEGDIVEVYDNHDEFLAMGHYQIGSIAVRILSFKKEVPDRDFWFRRIKQAYDYRKAIGLLSNDHTNTYRLIHAEGDEMPGLIVDYYNGVVVLQMHSVGMYLIRDILVDVLKEIYGENLVAIYDKSEGTLPHKAGLEPVNDYLYGRASKTVVSENDCKFRIDFKTGQKTGFFIDQRENRKLLGNYSKGKKVLNMFGYTGGFSVYALKAGAELVHSVDSSAKAIDLTNENIALNFSEATNHTSFATDAFQFMVEPVEDYDVIVLDPPAFAKHHNVLSNALQGYKRLNQKALEIIKPGGILFTFSCSQVVSKENFRKSVFAASANAKRSVRILHQLSQPVDHPVNIYHPEGEYLKGLVLYVE